MTDDDPRDRPKALAELVDDRQPRPEDLTGQERAVAALMHRMNEAWARLAADAIPELVERGVHPEVATGLMLEVAIATEARRRGLRAVGTYLARASQVLLQQADAADRAAH